MALSDIVNVSISATTQAPTAPGFGIPLILGAHRVFPELVRTYTSLSAMLTDGFTVSSPEYLAALHMQAQNPAPPRWAVGRRTNLPTEIKRLTPTLGAVGMVYTVTINGTDFIYTVGGDDTLKKVIDGLVTAIGEQTGYSASNHTDTDLDIEGDPGVWFSVAVSDTSGNGNGMGLWSVKDITADSSPDDDIAACAAFDNSWYAFIATHQNATDGATLATWAEANKKLFIIDLSDSDLKLSSIETNMGDLASVVCVAGEQRTAVCYHAKMEEFMSAAWLGKCLPMDPGSETWKFKTLASISADVLTDSETGFMKEKNCNWYQTVGGINITQEGKTGLPQYIDAVRFLDWLQANLQYDVFAVLANNKKVAYTDKGVALLEAAIRARLGIGVKKGGLKDDPAPTVTVPRVADEPLVNRANRTIPDIYFTGDLAGAIHSLTINGVVGV